MKNYKTKSTLFGYQIGLNNDNLYVCVPAKYFKDESVNILIDGVSKIVIASDREQEVTFKDKFNPAKNYELYYFKIKEY